MLGLRFKVGPIMYISFTVTDQDLHLGLLESPLLFTSIGCVPPRSITPVHILAKLCDFYPCMNLVT